MAEFVLQTAFGKDSCSLCFPAANLTDMTEVGAQFDSLRFSSPEMRRLGLALALSLGLHLFAWGGYEAGKQLGVWQRLHWPAWLYHLAIMKVVPAADSAAKQRGTTDVRGGGAADDRSAPKRKVLFQPKFTRRRPDQGKQERSAIERQTNRGRQNRERAAPGI